MKSFLYAATFGTLCCLLSAFLSQLIGWDGGQVDWQTARTVGLVGFSAALLVVK